jgi:hypothetical protein
MNVLNLSVVTMHGAHPCNFEVKRMVNGGYVGRDARSVGLHIEELARAGVPPPTSVPLIFPIPCRNVTTADEIEVVGPSTSGEVEYVLLLDGQDVLLGVGSDHTDRQLETHSVVKSKQICPNVLSRSVWRYLDVEAGWDDMVMRSWVRPTPTQAEILYQESSLAEILPAGQVLHLVKSRVTDHRYDGLVIFSGTVATVSQHIICGTSFRGELIDPRLGRTLACEYRVKTLDFLNDSDPH